MALSPETKHRLNKLAGQSLAGWIKLVGRTSRPRYDPPDALDRLRAGHPAILAFWHGQFLSIPVLAPPDVPVRIMVARHTDADILGEALTRFPSMALIRGAGAGGRQRDRGGATALRASLRALEDGCSLAMTADVPPGPARRAGIGIVTLARMSGRPIIPVAVASSRYKSFDTWSRMTVNLPFSRLVAVVGEPLSIARDADEATMEEARRRIEAGLNAVTQRAYKLAGADPARATPPVQLNGIGAGPPATPGFGLKAYRALTVAARPALPLLLKYRERQGKEDGRRMGERTGRAGQPRPAGELIWLHAASVGETNAILPLLSALAEKRSGASFLLTTGTTTSAELAGRRLPANVVHQFVPLDSPEYVRRFLSHWHPELAIFTESEIWPNLVLQAADRGIPLALVNARMSNRSYGRWRRATGISRPLFNRFSLVLAQNEKLARRFSDLGARRALAVGNLKIDAPPPPVDPAELARLKQALGTRPLLVAASTHEGEEVVLANAHRRLSREAPGFCTIIAPRHPERGLAVAEIVKGQGLSVMQRSLGALPTPDCEVYVADTLGELGTLYALSAIAFIGGSLVQRGGQNPIEAIRHGAAVLTGPHWENFPDAYQALFRHHGAREVHSADEIAQATLDLLADPDALARQKSGASAALATLSGALDKSVSALLALLPAEGPLRHAP